MKWCVSHTGRCACSSVCAHVQRFTFQSRGRSADPGAPSQPSREIPGCLPSRSASFTKEFPRKNLPRGLCHLAESFLCLMVGSTSWLSAPGRVRAQRSPRPLAQVGVPGPGVSLALRCGLSGVHPSSEVPGVISRGGLRRVPRMNHHWNQGAASGFKRAWGSGRVQGPCLGLA